MDEKWMAGGVHRSGAKVLGMPAAPASNLLENILDEIEAHM